MPWKNTCALNERSRFIAEYLQGDQTVAALCRRYGVSRKTGYKWMARHAAEGYTGLEDQSRAALRQPQAVEAVVEEWILRGRACKPEYGPKKLIAWVQRETGWPTVCAVSTAGEILKRHGLTVPRKLTRKGEPYGSALVDPTAANELWCIDFKGHFKVGDGQRCEPLTMTDAHSRYLLKCQSVPSTALRTTCRVCDTTFREFGLPARIRSDNGAPFGSVGLGGLSALSIWWIKLGITPERIAPGKPYQNGRHERMHSTLKQTTARPPAPTLRAQQRRFDAFRREFNEERPHEALGQQTPASFYTPSTRTYTGLAPAPEYPTGTVTRKVQSNGMLYWGSERVFLGEAFAREYIAFFPVEDGVWSLRFAHVPLGTFDERAGAIRPLTPARAARKA